MTSRRTKKKRRRKTRARAMINTKNRLCVSGRIFLNLECSSSTSARRSLPPSLLACLPALLPVSLPPSLPPCLPPALLPASSQLPSLHAPPINKLYLYHSIPYRHISPVVACTLLSSHRSSPHAALSLSCLLNPRPWWRRRAWVSPRTRRISRRN